MRGALPLLVLVLAGCAGAPLSDDGASAGGGLFARHEDLGKFHSPGAFEAAVDAGGKVALAGRGPEGEVYETLPIQADDLDAAWGDGRYTLAWIHWWGPPGPPPPPPPSVNVVVSSDPGWQGFLINPMGHHLQLFGGDEPGSVTRPLAHDFLENVTTLDADERQAVVDRLIPADDVLCNPCFIQDFPGGPRSDWFDAVDGGRAWTRLGGLDAVDEDTFASSSGRATIGDWWFHFDFDTATLTDRWGEGSTTTRVGSNDIVSFDWTSGQQHSDADSYARLVDALEGTGIAVPAADEIHWTHQPVETD